MSPSSNSFPANVDAEKAILGAILLDNAAHSEAAEKLEAEDFSLDSNRRVFLRMGELMNSQRAVDIVTLAESLARHKEIEAVGGVAYLASLTEGLPLRLVIEEYIRIVKEKSELRSMLAMFSTGIERIQDRGAQPAEIRDWMISGLPALTGASGTGYNLLELRELLSQPEVEVDYLVEGMLVRGTVSCLVAKPKVGKSTLARWLCLAIATGARFLGRETRRGDCIYLALEERAEEVTADFRAMGADGTERISVHADTAPEAAMISLVELVEKQHPALVIIDPLIRLVRVRDEKAYAEVYAALAPLIDSARATGTHILLTHHSGKALKSDAIDSPLGSTAIGGAVSTLIVLKRTENYRSIQTVQRVGKDMPETVLAFDPETRLLSIGGTRADADRKSVEEEILEYLRSVAESAEPERMEPDICDHVEGRTTLKRKALRSLVENGKVLCIGGGKRGDPFRYLFSCSQPMAGTREQETKNESQTSANIDEKLVPKNRQSLILVPGGLKV